MMNVLTDILYDPPTLMSSHNFKETLSHDKILPPQDITFEQEHLHQMNVSQLHGINQPILPSNHSGMDLYNSSNPIHLSSNTNAGFEDENDVSVFSDSFPEIVPSWLTHDFMKASDSLPSPDMLTNVSDIYPSTTESEHLEMLDLGFSSELCSQEVTQTRLNETCFPNSQKLLVNLPIQPFPNNNSLLMAPFNEVNMTDSNSNSIMIDLTPYGKFKQNTHEMSNHPSHNTPLLPCENNLIHLSSHSSLSDQCLTATSSPLMSTSQSQPHPVDVACDKLPQINLNHLDSFLGDKSELASIQALHQDFPNVAISNGNQSNQSHLDCNSNCHSTQKILTPNLASLSSTQDASIQVTENAITDNFSQSHSCFSCSKVSSGAPIEVIQCFKCKFCDYISVHKCAVESHISSSHSKSSNILPASKNDIPVNMLRLDSSTSNENEAHNGSKSNPVVVTNALSTLNTIENNRPVPVNANTCIDIQNKSCFTCIICNSLFSDAPTYKLHLFSIHNIDHDTSERSCPPDSNNFQCRQCNKLFLDSTSYNAHIISHHTISIEAMHVSALNGFVNSKAANQTKVAPVNSQQRILPKDAGQNARPNVKQRLLPKDSNSNCNESTSKTVKTVSSHKKAWQRKMKRELGSYICEFKGCNIRFRALDNSEYHKKCHVSGGNSFACPECRMTFQHWGTIAVHLWRIHKNDMELHACDQCSFRHYSLSHLEKTHRKIHLSECSFLCDACGKGFKNGKQMRNHRDRCHLHPKKNRNAVKASLDPKCKICSMHFASKVLLQHHEDTVHNVKRKSFMCNYCDYTTMKKSNLDLHMRQHTGEKPFVCAQCEYRTSDHNSLRRHKMTHSGEKMYRCPFCPYSAIQASSYKEHMKKHPGHNGVMFSCKICSFKTIKRDTYLLHVKDHESISMLQNASSMNEVNNSTEEMNPLAEAMDISLSYGDNNLIPNLNKNMQSFFQCLGINVVSLGQQSAT